MGIRIIFCLFTSSMMLLSFLPFYKYDLTEARFKEIKQLIKQKAGQ